MSEPYSDKRWWDDPGGIDSGCNECAYYLGYAKCEKHPDRIPSEIINASFPKTEKYNKKYCNYRKTNK